MHKSNHHAVRMLLQKYHDGLTVSEMAERLEKAKPCIQRALPQMADAYIDRWTSCKSQWAAVWCVIVPPENCPKPVKKTVKRKEMNGHAEFRSLVQ
jgi:hypothetical protein